MSILFALAAAVGWGSSDFAAGHASRRSSAVSVVILTHLSAVIALLVVTLMPGQGGSPAPADIVWGLAAGLGGGFGAMLLFRGLGKGSMAVVAPITATGAAMIPVFAGLLQGESISLLGALGVAVALAAIVMVSLSADGDDAAEPVADQVVPGVLAATVPVLERHAPSERWAAPRGVPVSTSPPRPMFVSTPLPPPPPPIPAGLCYEQVFGSSVALLEVPPVPDDISSLTGPGRRVHGTDGGPSDSGVPVGQRLRSILGRPGIVDALFSGLGFGLFFVFIARTSEEAGHWPLVSARAISVLMFVGVALVSAGAVLPERGSRRAVVLAGALDAAAAVFFVLSTRSGLLSVGAVLASMYPAVTIVLARFISQERIGRRQVVGLALAAGAVSLLAI